MSTFILRLPLAPAPAAIPAAAGLSAETLAIHITDPEHTHT